MYCKIVSALIFPIILANKPFVILRPVKDLQLAGEPIEATYGVRNGETRDGKTAGQYKGKYLITSLDLDAQAGDDAKYSVQLENCGKVEKVGIGLDGTAE